VEQVCDILTSAGMDGETVRMDYVSSVDAHKVEDAMRALVNHLEPAAEPARRDP
jgi:coenzyme F420-reducing hydrogenase delta subunit